MKKKYFFIMLWMLSILSPWGEVATGSVSYTKGDDEIYLCQEGDNKEKEAANIQNKYYQETYKKHEGKEIELDKQDFLTIASSKRRLYTKNYEGFKDVCTVLEKCSDGMLSSYVKSDKDEIILKHGWSQSTKDGDSPTLYVSFSINTEDGRISKTIHADTHLKCTVLEGTVEKEINEINIW